MPSTTGLVAMHRLSVIDINLSATSAVRAEFPSQRGRSVHYIMITYNFNCFGHWGSIMRDREKDVFAKRGVSRASTRHE